MSFFVKPAKNEYDHSHLRIGRIVSIVFIVIFAIILISSCFTSVPAGFTGVPVTFGKVADYTMDSGFHFKAPWTNVIKMDNRIQKHTISMSAFSKDIQETAVTYTINYQISKNDAMTIYRTIGKEYFDTVIAPNISEAVKTATAHYTAEGLINNRDKLATEIEEILKTLLEQYNIFVVGTAIEDLDFTDAFTNAVEAKQVAAQNKLKATTEQEQATMEEEAKAKRAIITANAEAEQAIIAANADLEVVKIQAEASLYAGQREAEMNQRIAEALSPELINYYWIKQWNGELPSTMLGENPSVMLTLDDEEK
ncbi:MAG: prohibitin family protein [Clostridia bacterium]|nr:prohibitin family protein [Clostridia bacterium]